MCVINNVVNEFTNERKQIWQDHDVTLKSICPEAQIPTWTFWDFATTFTTQMLRLHSQHAALRPRPKISHRQGDHEYRIWWTLVSYCVQSHRDLWTELWHADRQTELLLWWWSANTKQPIHRLLCQHNGLCWLNRERETERWGVNLWNQRAVGTS